MKVLEKKFTKPKAIVNSVVMSMNRFLDMCLEKQGIPKISEDN